MQIVVVEFHSSTQLLSIFCRRQEMIRFKTSLNYVIVLSALLGLVFVIGCGGSAEKQAMSDFLKLFSDTVSEYSVADENKKAEIKGKLDSFTSKWSDMKMELGSNVTPNALNDLDKEYQKIAEKYASLIGKS
jgi:hypothetical protein